MPRAERAAGWEEKIQPRATNKVTGFLERLCALNAENSVYLCGLVFVQFKQIIYLAIRPQNILTGNINMLTQRTERKGGKGEGEEEGEK